MLDKSASDRHLEIEVYFKVFFAILNDVMLSTKDYTIL